MLEEYSYIKVLDKMKKTLLFVDYVDEYVSPPKFSSTSPALLHSGYLPEQDQNNTYMA